MQPQMEKFMKIDSITFFYFKTLVKIFKQLYDKFMIKSYLFKK